MNRIKKRLFNPVGNDFADNQSPIYFGTSPLVNEPTGLFTIFEPRDRDIYEFVTLQKQRFWRADDYPIDAIKEGFTQLDENNKKIFEYTLSFLSFLDSVQVANISDLNVVYNMPEYRLWGTVHQYFEHEHSIAYSNILVGLFNNNTDEIKRIFYLAKDHPTLKKRNELIANNYQKLFDIFWEGIKNVSVDDYARALTYVLAGTYAMEAITFYMGFKIIEFYQFKYGILPMTNKMISEIKADELFHVKVMATIINRVKPFILEHISNEEFDEIVRNTLKAYYESDLEFYRDILQRNEFGITDKQIFDYITFLTNRRAALIGLKDIGLPNVDNPFKEIDNLFGYLESHDNSNRKDSFFESSSAAYIAQKIDDSALDDFDF